MKYKRVSLREFAGNWKIFIKSEGKASEKRKRKYI
jgi:hypothetical protein